MVLPTMVCVLDSTSLRKCINKIVCNLQRENHFLNLDAWEDNEKASKTIVATQKRDPCYLADVRIVPAALTYHTWVLDKHKQTFPKNIDIYIFFLIPHTAHGFVVRFNLCRA